MPKTKPTARRDVHQEVTDAIVSAIEAGAEGDDWQMPWASMAATGSPENAVTGKHYNGINVLLLWIAAEKAGFPTNQWAGFKQWKERGGMVRKGERGTMIVYVGSAVSRDKDGQTETDPDTGEPRRFSFAKWSHVWNVAQIDGIEAAAAPELPDLAERLEHCEEFVSATGAVVRWDQSRAFYRHSPDDFIGMPPREAFIDTDHSTATEGLYSTLFHELTHWTGDPLRCDRPRFDKGNMQSRDIATRALEELIAELGAAYLCAELGIALEPRRDHAVYIAHWLTALKRDKKAIFKAAGQASAAVAFLADLQPNAPRLGAQLAAHHGRVGRHVAA